jgi:hypothetical protein
MGTASSDLTTNRTAANASEMDSEGVRLVLLDIGAPVHDFASVRFLI